MTEPLIEPLSGDEALALLPLLAAGDLEAGEAARLRAAVAADPTLAPEAERLESVHALLARTLGRARTAAPAGVAPLGPPPEEADVAFGRFLAQRGTLTGEQVGEAFRQLREYRVQYPQLNLAQVLARHGLCNKETLLAAHQAFMARCSASSPVPAVIGSPVEEPVEAPARDERPKVDIRIQTKVEAPTKVPGFDAPRSGRRAEAERRSRRFAAGLGAVLALGACGVGVAAFTSHTRQRQKAEFLAAAQGALSRNGPTLEEAIAQRLTLSSALREDDQVEAAGEELDRALARAKARKAALDVLSTLPTAADLDERLAISGRAVAVDPSCSDALVARARARYAVARTLPAPRAKLAAGPLADLDEAIRQEPDRPLAYAVKGQLLLVDRHDAEGRQQAESALRAARVRDPDGAIQALAEGLLAAGVGQLDAAIEAFTLALARSPTLVDAQLARARARLRKREFGKALEDANEALRQDPWSADALVLQAEGRYFATGSSDRAGALRTLEKALRLDPEDAHALAVRAHVRLERDRFGDLVSGPEDRAASKADAQRALAVSPEEPLAHLSLGELAADENPVVAKQHASRAIECGRHLPQTWMLRGRLRGRESDEYAIQDFEEVLKIAPTNVHALTNKAAVLFTARRDAEEATVLLDRAVRLDPDLPWAYYWRGMIALAPPRSSQKYAIAVTQLSEAITRQPQFPDAYFRRACAYHDMGRYLDCLKDLAQAESQRSQGNGSSTTQGVFQQHWVELMRGHCLFFTRQYPEADAAYRRYRDTAPPGDKAMPGVMRRLEELRQLFAGELEPEQLSKD